MRGAAKGREGKGCLMMCDPFATSSYGNKKCDIKRSDGFGDGKEDVIDIEVAFPNKSGSLGTHTMEKGGLMLENNVTGNGVGSGTGVGGQEKLLRRHRQFYKSLYLFIKMSNKHLVRQKKLFSAVTLAILGLGLTVLFWYNRDKLVFFLEWLSSIGVWGNVLFILVFIVVGFPFMLGYIPLTVGAGYLYGMVMGTVTVSIGATTGACVAFWLCRTLTKKWIEKHLSSNAKFNLFMLEVENNAWKITLITRLLPFPFGLVNGLFALSSISFHVFLIGSFLGLLPFQLMWTYFGTTLRSIAEAVNGEMPFGVWQQFLLLIQIALGIGLALYLYQLGKGAMMVPEPEITIEEKTEEQEIKEAIVSFSDSIVVVEVPEMSIDIEEEEEQQQKQQQQLQQLQQLQEGRNGVSSPFKGGDSILHVQAPYHHHHHHHFAAPSMSFVDDAVITNVMTRDSFIDGGNNKRELGAYRSRARSFTTGKVKKKKLLSRILDV